MIANTVPPRICGIGSGEVAPGGMRLRGRRRPARPAPAVGIALGMKSTTTSASTSRTTSVRPTKSYSSCFGSGGRISISRGGTRGALSCWLIVGVGALAGVPFCSASSSRISSRFGVLKAFWISLGDRGRHRRRDQVALLGVRAQLRAQRVGERVLPCSHRLFGAGPRPRLSLAPFRPLARRPCGRAVSDRRTPAEPV